MGKRGVPNSDIPEAPKTEGTKPKDAPTGTVRRGKKATAKKKEGDFNAEMAILRMGADTMSPEDVRAAVLGAVERHGEGKVFEALRAVEMPEEFLAPVVPATTQDVAPVTSADNSMPATQPATEQAAAAPVAAAPAADKALPKPGTFTVKDVLAGRVAVPEATDPKAANAGQPSPAAQQAAVQAVQQPARNTYEPTADEMLGQLEAAYGPGFPPFTPAESVANPLIGLAEQGFANGEFPYVQGANPSVRLINPVLPKPTPRSASMEEIMRGLGMTEPSPDPGRLQAGDSPAPERPIVGVEDGVGAFQVNPPRPGIKQMQESLQQAEAPPAPKKTIYETLGMNPPADLGTSKVYKNIPTGLKAAGILGLLGGAGAAAAYGLGAFDSQPQPQEQQEDDWQKAQRILMTPMKFGQ